MFRRGFLVFPLVLILMFAIGACGGGADETTPQTDPEPTAQEPPPVEEPPVVQEEPMEEPEPEPEKMPVLEDVFFEFDKYSLTTDARRSLEKNAQQLKDASSYDVLIEGHCDERGTVAYNLALGERRAKATKDYLTSLGVSAARISTVSYGEERPFDPRSNEEAWAKNRRAHFVVQK